MRKQSIFKRYPLLSPIIALIIILSGLLFMTFYPTVTQNITYEGDVGGDDESNPWYLTLYEDYIYNEIQYTWEDILYVHQDGDNTTGGYDWEHAYTDLPSAIAYAHGTPYWTTLILVGAGTWDVLQPAYQTIDKQIILIGASRDDTIFINTHPTATAVFKVENMFSGHRFSVRIEDSCDGIIVENNIIGGMYEPDIDLSDINFITNVTTLFSPQGLALGISNGGEFKKINFYGFSHATITAINISNSWDNVFDDISMYDLQVGILIEINNSDNNVFSNLNVFNASVGIDIDGGNNQHFYHIQFEDVATAVDDEVGDSYWYDVHTDWELSAILPNDLTGVVINTGGAGNVYGADAMLFDGIAIDVPFYLVAIIYEPSVQERFGFRLWNDGAYFFQTVVEGTINQVDRITVIIPIIFNAHSRIWCSTKSESGGDNLRMWLEVISI